MKEIVAIFNRHRLAFDGDKNHYEVVHNTMRTMHSVMKDLHLMGYTYSNYKLTHKKLPSIQFLTEEAIAFKIL